MSAVHGHVVLYEWGRGAQRNVTGYFVVSIFPSPVATRNALHAAALEFAASDEGRVTAQDRNGVLTFADVVRLAHESYWKRQGIQSVTIIPAPISLDDTNLYHNMLERLDTTRLLQPPNL